MEPRYFALFKKTTSLADKIMPFTGMTRQQVWDYMAHNYSNCVRTVVSEQELSRILPNSKLVKNYLVPQGTECKSNEVS